MANTEQAVSPSATRRRGDQAPTQRRVIFGHLSSSASSHTPPTVARETMTATRATKDDMPLSWARMHRRMRARNAAASATATNIPPAASAAASSSSPPLSFADTPKATVMNGGGSNNHPTADAVLASLRNTFAAAGSVSDDGDKSNPCQYQSFVLARHPKRGLILLKDKSNNTESPSECPFPLIGGHLSQEDWQPATTTAGGGGALAAAEEELLLAAAKRSAARELYKEAGIHVENQLHRLQPARLRPEPCSSSFLACQDAHQRLYFVLEVHDSDFLSPASIASPERKKEEPNDKQEEEKKKEEEEEEEEEVRDREEVPTPTTTTTTTSRSMALPPDVSSIAISDTRNSNDEEKVEEDKEKEVVSTPVVVEVSTAAAEEASSTSSTTSEEIELYKAGLQYSSIPFTASSSSLWDQHAAATKSSTDAAAAAAVPDPHNNNETTAHVSMIPLSLQLFFYGKSLLDHPFSPNTAEDDYALFGSGAPTASTTVCRRPCCTRPAPPPRRDMSSSFMSDSPFFCQAIDETDGGVEKKEGDDEEDDVDNDDDVAPSSSSDKKVVAGNSTGVLSRETTTNSVSWKGTAATRLTRQPSELSSSSSALHRVMRDYIAACHLYGCSGDRINAGVMTTIRFRLPTLRTSGSFHDADMLALAEVLLQHGNATLSHIRRLDFSISSREGRLPNGGRKGFRSHGALTLSKVLQQSHYIQEVFLQRNRIGPYGASALFLAASRNAVLQKLVLRRCHVGERGALSFATHICPSPVTALREVDLSVNGIGFRGSIAVERALLQRLKRQQRPPPTTTRVQTPKQNTESTDPPLLLVDLDGNLAFQEIMNSITHGLGILLGVVGTLLLSRRVEDSSLNHVLSCFVYSMSLLALYTSSTLFHSFFALPPAVRSIFAAFDHCAIYILIAGSYTPFLRITLSHEPLWSVYLLGFLWSCCCAGIYVEICHLEWAYKSKFSLAMYLGMGWSCLVCMPDLMAVLHRDAIRLLVLGGVAYTSGVPFFVRNNNLDHSMWHCFVLAGSIFHWWCVYRHVASLP